MNVLEYQTPKELLCERDRIGLVLLQAVPEDFTEMMVQYEEKNSQKDLNQTQNTVIRNPLSFTLNQPINSVIWKLYYMWEGSSTL